MNQDLLARQIASGRMHLAALAETFGAASMLQRELAPETLEELGSALEELQDAAEVLHQEHEQLLLLHTIELELRERTVQLTAANTLKDELLIREQAMRATADLAEQRFHDLVQSLDAIVWEADATTWQFTFVSQSAEALLGYPVERWLAEPAFWVNLVHPEDRAQVLSVYQAVIQEGGDHAFEYRAVAADGRVVWLRDIVRAIPDGLGRVQQLRGLMVDITEHKRLEAQFLQAQKMESIGRLAGGVAHDFNNVLTAITGYTQLALEELPPDAAMRGDLEEIQKAADRAVGLTGQLLAFARRQIFEPQIVNLNDLILDVDKLLRRLIGEDIELMTLPASDLHFVKADCGQITQVLLNLAVNARDAMPYGGQLIIETANVPLDQAYTRQHVNVVAGDYVMLSVSDTGIGMTEAVQQHLFEPFFTTKEPGRGTGLGLATSYGIVKQHGGHLWVYSEVGQGTTFKIYLPSVAAEASPRPARPDEGVVPHGIETILLVEDEPAVRALAARALREHGYTVLEAANGEEALRITQQAGVAIQLLLTDVVMPHIGGRDLAARLKALQPTVKAVFASGYTDDVVVHHGIVDPGVAFLQKPYAPAALVRKVREVLDS